MITFRWTRSLADSENVDDDLICPDAHGRYVPCVVEADVQEVDEVHALLPLSALDHIREATAIRALGIRGAQHSDDLVTRFTTQLDDHPPELLSVTAVAAAVLLEPEYPLEGPETEVLRVWNLAYTPSKGVLGSCGAA